MQDDMHWTKTPPMEAARQTTEEAEQPQEVESDVDNGIDLSQMP